MKLNNWQIAGVLGFGAALVAVGMGSCVSIPKGAQAVKPFNKDQYLGKWYEIARMDFKFEKGLSNVTAQYDTQGNDAIKVTNRGYSAKENKWKESTGKAKPAGNADEGRLKVSFFGPFYAGYNVIAMDKDYQYALVAGNNLNYLWILSRQTTIPDAVKQAYLEKARNLGYEVDKLIWTKHDKSK
ncbi:lipocalin family protein [Mucilaginibacter sp. Bleaf8]|uniref:lipocalin family protein n=1 Tax=Mucilaginibacter sp. Bleaf8 TaxID=2834430 RepID=UPI001BCEEB99|nr:lipocalin family protein [Mucilaginibacter sp. Bleaf8]MBS7564110.1 lipocalin family protein [Mucilaginibacter sp. Bleaf8]